MNTDIPQSAADLLARAAHNMDATDGLSKVRAALVLAFHATLQQSLTEVSTDRYVGPHAEAVGAHDLLIRAYEQRPTPELLVLTACVGALCRELGRHA